MNRQQLKKLILEVLEETSNIYSPAENEAANPIAKEVKGAILNALRATKGRSVRAVERAITGVLERKFGQNTNTSNFVVAKSNEIVSMIRGYQKGIQTESDDGVASSIDNTVEMKAVEISQFVIDKYSLRGVDATPAQNSNSWNND